MDERFLYLITTGRTSGQPRRIEIWYVEHGGKHYIVSERRGESHWVKNLKKTPAVLFSVGTRGDNGSAVPEARAVARVVDAEEEPALAREVRARMDAKYRWSEGLVVEIASEPLP